MRIYGENMDTVKINKGNVKMIAHRGVSRLEKENACAAFVAAGNRSYFGVETDVHVTRDGRFVIIHDATTKRVSLDKVDLNVEESDYCDIEKVVLPDIDGSTHRRDIRIPLLEDYIEICKKYDKKCVLEIKFRLTEETLGRMLEEIGKCDYLSNVIFISFNLDNCIDVKRACPNNEVQWLYEGKPIDDELIRILTENRLDLDIFFGDLTKEGMELCRENGIKVNCWTCDDENNAERLVELGVDYITSNILE